MRPVDPSRGRVHDPWSPRGTPARLRLVVLWAVFTAVLSALYLRLPPSPDHVTYDYIGWMVSEGAVLYRDVADSNWPGQMLIDSERTGAGSYDPQPQVLRCFIDSWLSPL